MNVTAYVGEPPGTTDLLLGDEALRVLQAHFDADAALLTFAVDGLAIHLSTFARLPDHTVWECGLRQIDMPPPAYDEFDLL